MRFTTSFSATALAAAAVAVMTAFAPIAAATPDQTASGGSSAAAPREKTPSQQSCVSLGGTQNVCQSPGNAQIYDAPPQVDYFPYAGGGT